VQRSNRVFRQTVDEMRPSEVLAEIDAKVDASKMEEHLVREGVVKFADPQKALLKLITDKRRLLVGSRE
jgi:transaldolase